MVETITLSHLEEKVRQDTNFFDHLTELIPAALFFPQESNTEQWKNVKNKNQNKNKKKEMRVKAKEVKRQKFDPSNPRTVVEIQQMKAKKEEEKKTMELKKKEKAINKKSEKASMDPSNEKTQSVSESEMNGMNKNPSSNSMDTSSKKEAITYDDLRERLKMRLESMRLERRAKEKEDAALQAKQWLTSKHGRSIPNESEEKKEIVEEGREEIEKKNEKDGKERKEGKKGEAKMKVDAKRRKREKDENEDDTEQSLQLEFGKLETKLEGSVEITQKRKKKKTQQLLAKAVALQDLLKKEDGNEEVIKHAWEASLDKASGKKVLDNPKLLRRSLQRKQKAKIKSAKQWEERNKHVKASMESRQTKRKEKIKERKDVVKASKIAKREKKLMRPGFEGRVDKVLNSKPAS